MVCIKEKQGTLKLAGLRMDSQDSSGMTLEDTINKPLQGFSVPIRRILADFSGARSSVRVPAEVFPGEQKILFGQTRGRAILPCRGWGQSFSFSFKIVD